jgi:hypothetical protein
MAFTLRNPKEPQLLALGAWHMHNLSWTMRPAFDTRYM